MKFLITLILAFCLAPTLNAGSVPNVDLEWEAVPKAEKYELEFKLKDSDKKPRVFSSKDTHFNSSLPAGDYIFRIRSVTKEDGPGQWSQPVTLPVLPVTVKLVAPENKEQLQVNDSKQLKVEFKWKKALNAKTYILKIWSSKSEKVYKRKTTKTEHHLKLKAGREYFWEVQAIGPNGIQYEGSIQRSSFLILGKPLNTPELKEVPNITSKEVLWKKVPNATFYSFKLYRKDIGGPEWSLFQDADEYQLTSIPLNKKLTPGQYKVELIAKSSMRLDSDPFVQEFLVKPSFRELSGIPKKSSKDISTESNYKKNQF